jgi:hypothetical protein
MLLSNTLLIDLLASTSKDRKETTKRGPRIRNSAKEDTRAAANRLAASAAGAGRPDKLWFALCPQSQRRRLRVGYHDLKKAMEEAMDHAGRRRQSC